MISDKDIRKALEDSTFNDEIMKCYKDAKIFFGGNNMKLRELLKVILNNEQVRLVAFDDEGSHLLWMGYSQDIPNYYKDYLVSWITPACYDELTIKIVEVKE